MPKRLLITCFSLACLVSCLDAPVATAQQPKWVPNVIATGELRAKIEQTPIPERPGRPLHVYGNTVRMMQKNEPGSRSRPLRQIFFGTPELRNMVRYYRN